MSNLILPIILFCSKYFLVIPQSMVACFCWFIIASCICSDCKFANWLCNLQMENPVENIRTTQTSLKAHCCARKKTQNEMDAYIC